MFLQKRPNLESKLTLSLTGLTAPWTYGFLSVVEIPSAGHCGGLLIVSQIGRPIEFHCTAPVATNRAQEIMYGQTYTGFICADQIGMSLVDKTKNQPTLFLTDCADALPLSELIDSPLVLVENSNVANPFDGQGLKKFTVKDHVAFCVNAQQDQLDSIEQCVKSFTRSLPIEEPFERIRQAIEEAHAGCRAA